MRQHREAFLKPAFEVEVEAQSNVHTHTQSLKKRLHMGKAYAQIQTMDTTKAHATEPIAAQQQLNS